MHEIKAAIGIMLGMTTRRKPVETVTSIPEIVDVVMLVNKIQLRSRIPEVPTNESMALCLTRLRTYASTYTHGSGAAD